jgi:methylenetetrahydrofolate reductase (NADPH)
MRISDALARQRPFFSFEFFPPKDDEAREHLLETVEALHPLRPAFVSVTWGAGGSTRARTLDLAKQIKSRSGIEVMAHVTCTGSTRTQLREIFTELEAGGIENIMALRGDPPKGSAQFMPGENGFHQASELIAMLRRVFRFCIGAACYPEKHPEAPDMESDLRHLREKVDAGADFLVTQFFFENERYFTFVARARAAGITVPILPGLMPITNYQQIARMSTLGGGTIPPKLLAELEARRDEPKAVEDLGVAYATLQAAELLRNGAPGIHFYTLNRSPATRAIVSALLAATAWRTFTPR